MQQIATNLALVRSKIEAACHRAGRDPAAVALLPISKTQPPAAILEAVAAGYHRFGENRVQEALDKYEQLAGWDGLEWVLTGHLQTNKARHVARFASEFQALDSLGLAKELDRRLLAAGRQLDVLIQVNSSGEDSKFGLPPDQVLEFAKSLKAFDALRPRGLMTLALPGPDPAPVAACFERMRKVQEQLRTDLSEPYDELSMGMSGDFELAIEHGSTLVRIGTAIFGSRPNP